MTRKEISDIMSTMTRIDNRCQGSPQQVANGFYRCFEMLVLLTRALDIDQKHRVEITTVVNTFNRQNNLTQSAPQESANGSYRIVELLQVLIKVLDTSGRKSIEASSVIRSLNTNEVYCQSAPQQIANGSYRIAEMLQVLVGVVAPDKSIKASSMIAAMNRTNALCNGAPQQSANGTDTIAQLMELLVTHLDTKRAYSVQLSAITRLKIRNNSMCQGADQQSANYLYRTLEMMEILAKMQLEVMEARTAKYWEEHADRRLELIEEKSECKKKISEIRASANKVNDGGRIDPLRAQIKDIEKTIAQCGQEELQKLKAEYNGVDEQRKALGFFKFSEKKALKAQLDEIQGRIQIHQQKVNAEVTGYRNQISQLQNNIKMITDEVDRQKKLILKGCDPHEARIQAIDFELTRQR